MFLLLVCVFTFQLLLSHRSYVIENMRPTDFVALGLLFSAPEVDVNVFQNVSGRGTLYSTVMLRLICHWH